MGKAIIKETNTHSNHNYHHMVSGWSPLLLFIRASIKYWSMNMNGESPWPEVQQRSQRHRSQLKFKTVMHHCLLFPVLIYLVVRKLYTCIHIVYYMQLVVLYIIIHALLHPLTLLIIMLFVSIDLDESFLSVHVDVSN